MSANGLAMTEGYALVRPEEMAWIGGIPSRGAEACGDRLAVVFAEKGTSLTYAQLDLQSRQFAHLIRGLGIVGRQRIAYLGKNSDIYLPVLFGSIIANVVLVPINWRLTAREIAYQLEDSGATLLICDPELAPVAQVAVSTADRRPEVLLTETAGNSIGLRQQLAEPATDAPSLPSAWDRKQIVLQLYTSGTTGNPKGVMISHYALSMARHCELEMPELDFYGRGKVSLSAMPNFHVGGMSWVLMGLVRQGTVVITADPSPKNMLALLRAHRAEYSFIVPTVIRAIVDELKVASEPPPELSGIFYGAMPIGESLLKDAMQWLKCPLVQFFGMTENTGSATYLCPADHDPGRPALLKSVGKPYPGMALEIRDPDRKILPQGQSGEIWIKSPTQMSGYWNLPEKTAEAVVDGWYASGDGGYIDEAGYLFLTDRIKDMIVTGGENVYPVEVEEALRQHPAVLDAACVGLPDERWGEAVAAFVELRPGSAATEDEIRQFVRLRIASYKCPKAIQFVSALPRTASGKVKRADLRAGGAAKRG